MSSTASIWLQFDLLGRLLRAGSKSALGFNHFCRSETGLKPCGNDNSCPRGGPNGPCEPPNAGGKEELPYKNTDRAKGEPRKSRYRPEA